eukprot:TRINITY_DN11742_c0_g1_i1.p1 TRINITY_DN11742_c0_g1~~TRINITY_DN11742_c0_g1_i1.p1  ORF type:complete len:318 (-),score=31.05 TRINITY_DN11742_c0_g1_i1:42-995(-)
MFGRRKNKIKHDPPATLRLQGLPLLQLPLEMIEHVLVSAVLNARDIGRVSCTCTQLHQLLDDTNSAVWHAAARNTFLPINNHRSTALPQGTKVASNVMRARGYHSRCQLEPHYRTWKALCADDNRMNHCLVRLWDALYCGWAYNNAYRHYSCRILATALVEEQNKKKRPTLLLVIHYTVGGMSDLRHPHTSSLQVVQAVDNVKEDDIEYILPTAASVIFYKARGAYDGVLVFDITSIPHKPGQRIFFTYACSSSLSDYRPVLLTEITDQSVAETMMSCENDHPSGGSTITTTNQPLSQSLVAAIETKWPNPAERKPK